MLKNILIIILFILGLSIYTFFIKQTPKERTKAVSEITITKPEVPKEVQKSIQKEHNKTPKVSEPNTTIPSINLKYYNLSLEKDYNTIYKNETQSKTELKYPPLINKEDTEDKSDLNFNLTPEINYNQQTKEITIDGLQIQLEKKF